MKFVINCRIDTKMWAEDLSVFAQTNCSSSRILFHNHELQTNKVYIPFVVAYFGTASPSLKDMDDACDDFIANYRVEMIMTDKSTLLASPRMLTFDHDEKANRTYVTVVNWHVCMFACLHKN